MLKLNTPNRYLYPAPTPKAHPEVPEVPEAHPEVPEAHPHPQVL